MSESLNSLPVISGSPRRPRSPVEQNQLQSTAAKVGSMVIGVLKALAGAVGCGKKDAGPKTMCLNPNDCMPLCGNGLCEGGEYSPNCPEDCGTICGDRVCNGDENPDNCKPDCIK